MENLEQKYATTLEHNFVNPANAAADKKKFPSHWERYEFARQYAKGKRILDVACGSGYGTDILKTESGISAIGLDIDEGAIEWANNYYGSKVKYLQIGEENWPVQDHSIDLVVSFETIEHSRQPQQFLAEISRVLAPGGQLLISTPLNETEERFKPANQYHLREYNWQEFDGLLAPQFIVQESYSQISNLSSASEKISKSKLGFIKKLLPGKLKKFILNILMSRGKSKSGQIVSGQVDNANVQIRIAIKK